jgi:hypothetical protein
MINTKLQSIIDTKSAIGNAITNKGGTITTNTPFFNYAAQIDGISTGTPQTIFAASDGSKWALTNVVNLTNVSNNVTHDFNYWQPANNSTSDPILNVGTVNGNISGNIKIVQVNQVNIAQYVNIVATDTLGGKYVGYNGYDEITNPTPTGNTTFNRWLLNNSATGTVIFANATFTTGTYNGPNSTLNEASMPFVNNTPVYIGAVYSIKTNDNLIFAAGTNGGTLGAHNDSVISKYNESTLDFIENSPIFGGPIYSMTLNNGLIYAAGAGPLDSNGAVQKFYQSNLTRVANASNYGARIFSIDTNNGFIYAGGDVLTGVNRGVAKYHESNLVLVGNTVNYGGSIRSITTNNGFIYVGGLTNQTVQKFYESNLVFVGNTVSYNGDITSITTNNGFIYAGGFTNNTVQKFYESNLVFVGNTPSYGSFLTSITTNNGFIYAGGGTLSGTNRGVSKYYEGNLALVGNTVNFGGSFIRNILINNTFIYVGGASNQGVKQYEETGLSAETLTFYTATKIKE